MPDCPVLSMCAGIGLAVFHPVSACIKLYSVATNPSLHKESHLAKEELIQMEDDLHSFLTGLIGVLQAHEDSLLLGAHAADLMNSMAGQPSPPPRMASNGRAQPPPPPPSQAAATFQARQPQPKKPAASALQRGPRCDTVCAAHVPNAGCCARAKHVSAHYAHCACMPVSLLEAVHIRSTTTVCCSLLRIVGDGVPPWSCNQSAVMHLT